MIVPTARDGHAAGGCFGRRYGRGPLSGILSSGKAWLSFLAILLLATQGGCGCGKEFDLASGEEIEEAKRLRAERAEKERLAEEASRRAHEKERAAKRRAREEEFVNRRAAAKRSAGSSDSTTGSRLAASAPARPKPVAVELPDELSDWKPDDFVNARRYDSPRLAEAVDYLARRPADRDAAAGQLLTLLGTGVEGLGSVRDEEATEAIVRALAENGTATAWRGIEGLLDGTTFAIDGDSAREAALGMLVERGDSTAEKILLAALLKSSRSTSKTVRDLTASFLKNHGSKTSDEFRVVLAGYSVDPRLHPQQRDLLQEFLLEPKPKNLGAQVVIYRAPATPEAVRMNLRVEFQRLSSAAIAALADLPPEALVPRRKTEMVPRLSGDQQTAWSSRRRTTSSGRRAAKGPAAPGGPIDPDIPARVARYLWAPEMVSQLAAELYQVDDLEGAADLLATVSAMPVDPMRASLYATLQRNWQDGPGGIESTGVFDRVVVDPGILVVLKTMPRNDPGADDSSRSAPWLKNRTSKDKYRPPGLAEVREMVGDVETEWMRVCGQMVLRLSERFEAAAVARGPRSGSESGAIRRTSAGYVRLPFELHDGARVVTRYELTWPHDLSEPSCRDAAGPIRISHVRIEEQNRYNKVLAYYRHQIPNVDEHLSNQGAWFDGLLERPESGTRVSLDVLIYRDRITGTPDNEHEKLRIDVLMIEVFDPAHPRSTSSAGQGDPVSYTPTDS